MKCSLLAVLAALGRPGLRGTALILRVAEPSSRILIPIFFRPQKSAIWRLFDAWRRRSPPYIFVYSSYALLKLQKNNILAIT